MKWSDYVWTTTHYVGPLCYLFSNIIPFGPLNLPNALAQIISSFFFFLVADGATYHNGRVWKSWMCWEWRIFFSCQAALATFLLSWIDENCFLPNVWIGSSSIEKSQKSQKPNGEFWCCNGGVLLLHSLRQEKNMELQFTGKEFYGWTPIPKWRNIFPKEIKYFVNDAWNALIKVVTFPLGCTVSTRDVDWTDFQTYSWSQWNKYLKKKT